MHALPAPVRVDQTGEIANTIFRSRGQVINSAGSIVGFGGISLHKSIHIRYISAPLSAYESPIC